MRKHIARKLLVFALVVTASLAFAPARPALAWYNGQNPSGSGCDTNVSFAFQYAFPLKNKSYPGDTTIAGEVNLRWSRDCKTNWSRAVIYSPFVGYGSSVRAWIEQNGVQKPFHGTPVYNNGNVYWSQMFNGDGIPTKACASIIVGESVFQGCTIAG